MNRFKIYFKVFRSMFILWFLRRYTEPEVLPLTLYGTFVVHEGDIAVINGEGNKDLGEVVKVIPELFDVRTVHIRLFRRPNYRRKTDDAVLRNIEKRFGRA